MARPSYKRGRKSPAQTTKGTAAETTSAAVAVSPEIPRAGIAPASVGDGSGEGSNPSRAKPDVRLEHVSRGDDRRHSFGVPKPRALESRDRIGVLGKTGMGKSFLVRELLKRQSRVIVLDINHEYFPGVCREGWYARELAEHPEKVLEGDLSMAVWPDDDSPASAAKAFALVSGLLRAAAMPVCLCAEEFGDWSSYVREEITTLATRGRHKQIALIAVAQRPALIHPNVRSQFSELWCFQLDEPADLEAIEERTRDEDFSQAVRALEPYRALAWTAPTFASPATAKR